MANFRYVVRGKAGVTVCETTTLAEAQREARKCRGTIHGLAPVVARNPSSGERLSAGHIAATRLVYLAHGMASWAGGAGKFGAGHAAAIADLRHAADKFALGEKYTPQADNVIEAAQALLAMVSADGRSGVMKPGGVSAIAGEVRNVVNLYAKPEKARALLSVAKSQTELERAKALAGSPSKVTDLPVSVAQARAASEELGWDETCRIVGAGGLSGASSADLRRLVVAAAKVRNPSPREHDGGELLRVYVASDAGRFDTGRWATTKEGAHDAALAAGFAGAFVSRAYDDEGEPECVWTVIASGKARNPSSGAKQRARGTRKKAPVDPLALPHDKAMRAAANRRKSVKALQPRPGKDSLTAAERKRLKEWHAELLAHAATVRPKLPNPAKPRAVAKKKPAIVYV